MSGFILLIFINALSAVTVNIAKREKVRIEFIVAGFDKFIKSRNSTYKTLAAVCKVFNHVAMPLLYYDPGKAGFALVPKMHMGQDGASTPAISETRAFNLKYITRLHLLGQYFDWITVRPCLEVLFSHTIHLQSLQIIMKQIQPTAFQLIVESCPRLLALSIRGHLDPETHFDQLDLPGMANLIALDIGFIETNRDLQQSISRFLARSLRQLQHFRVSFHMTISQPLLIELLVNNPALKTFHVFRVEEITVDWFPLMQEHGKCLDSIIIGFDAFPDTTLEWIALDMLFPRLRHLCMLSIEIGQLCEHLTLYATRLNGLTMQGNLCRDGEGREFLKARGKQLKYLYLMNASPFINDIVVVSILCPNLKYLYLNLNCSEAPLLSFLESKFDQVMGLLLSRLVNLETLSFDQLPPSLVPKAAFYQSKYNTNHAPFDSILM